jgi:hypothetical protein
MTSASRRVRKGGEVDYTPRAARSQGFAPLHPPRRGLTVERQRGRMCNVGYHHRLQEGFGMSSRVGLLLLSCAFFALCFAGHAEEKKEEKKTPKNDPETAVRLRLNAVEAAVQLAHYEALVKRELRLKDSVRACEKSGDVRLPEYKQALKETQSDLDTARKRMAELDSEKQKLTRARGKKQEPAPQETDRILEQILDRLTAIEKRLEKIEKQKE